MLTFILRRIGQLLPVLLGVVTLVFLLLHFIPGDPVDLMLGEQAMPTDRQALRAALGLDEPLWRQYGDYLGGLLRGDLGRSVHSQRPVGAEIWSRFPASFELMVGGLCVALGLALPLGVAAALRPRSWIDGGAMAVSFLGVSIPNFWLGPLLILAFAVELDWLPVSGRGTWRHMVLPAITLGTAMAAMLSRLIRASLLDALGNDYVRTARAKGLREARVVIGHALPNALIPVVTVVGLQIGGLLSGAIITEAVFSWPGVGSLLLDGIQSRDYPLVQGCVLVVAMIYVAVNLLTDILYAWLDPRVRLA